MGETCTETTSATATRTTDHAGITVVAVTGEIDMSCEQPIRATILRQLDRRPAGLVLDLAEVDFFGSAGIQLVVEAALRAERLDVPLAVATDRRTVLRPLEITLVHETVAIHPTLGAALAALRNDVPSRQPANR
ncbi:STAS domain-containing protein [Saccharothrix texasensis]|uniref:Anti-sigma factor antagonist n=1 Tax=Saccharothrix texasensis TaxID=103734 RepID=A0A3N1HGV3_9PSEU|nr:STAS domain-containing protein [Saccharothrix texasensis]ROP41720.1 anti-sigma B factor antagonist [Saccharothrix texasensis]